MEKQNEESNEEYNTRVIRALKDQAEEVDSWLDRLKKMLFLAENEEPVNDKKKSKKNT
jgi:sulfur transfer protein SufE